MRLTYGVPSPYSRKARIAMIEKGLGDRIEQAPLNPFERPDDARSLNPLGKVPALTLDDGATLFDSFVIVEYLDSLSETPKLLPSAGPERWKALRLHALAHGLLDSLYNAAMELRRPEEVRSSDVLAAHIASATRALDQLEAEAETLRAGFGLGQITAACAPDYIELRLANHLDWSAGRPNFASWYDGVASRPSVASTRPS